MCLARGRCAAALDRVCDLCSKNNTAEGSSYVPLVDEYELASEFAELRDDTTLVSTGAPMTRRMTPWTPTTRLLTTLLALATTTAVVFRARAMTTMMMMTVIDVFALLPDLIECKYLRPPIADACALVVNTLIKIYIYIFFFIRVLYIMCTASFY